MTVSKSLGSRLLGGSKDFSDQELADVPKGVYTTTIDWTAERANGEVPSADIMAVLPSKEKTDEYMFITSHYDHEGIKNGVIYYGADDDGSGTTSVVAIAHAFAEASKKGFSPKRNIVFMNVSGEEKGLLGSQYYSEHPVYPLEKTSVDLNIDMVGRIDPTYKGDSMNYVYLIGEDKLSSDLQPITDKVNKNYNMELDRRFNDPKDPNNASLPEVRPPPASQYPPTHQKYQRTRPPERPNPPTAGPRPDHAILAHLNTPKYG
jgi:Zn-dependent M28 family amino/carboxypeptidase